MKNGSVGEQVEKKATNGRSWRKRNLLRLENSVSKTGSGRRKTGNHIHRGFGSTVVAAAADYREV